MAFDRFISRAASQSRVIDLEEGERSRAILRFQIPLGITALIMASTFTIVNAGLARTISPQAALAAFALAQSVTNLFASPLWSTRNMMVALGTDRVSMHNAIVATLGSAFLVTVWIASLGYTPLGEFIYARIFGAPAHLLPDIMDVVRLCILLPAIYGLRGWGQAVILLHRRTPLLVFAMLIRLALMIPMAFYLPRTGFFSPTGVGGAIWVFGMCFEAISCALFARRLNRTYPDVIPAPVSPSASTSLRESVKFLLPLIAHALLSSSTFPAINAALARSTSPELSLASFQVAWSLAFLFVAFVHPNMGQTVMVFLESGRWWRSLRRVGYWIIGLDSLAMALTALTGAAAWILVGLMGIDPSLMGVVRVILLLTVSSVILGGLVDMWVGVAMKSRRTGIVGIAKGADVLIVILVAFGAVSIRPDIGGIIAPIALGLGLAANLLILYKMVPIEVPETRKPR